MDAPLPLAGRYRFLRRLRGTAAGVIWLASDPFGRRTVVVSSVTPARVTGLRRMVGLAHPHLASVVDFIDDVPTAELPTDGAPMPRVSSVAVAEHLPGQTLHERLEAGRVPVRKAVLWTAKLATALHAVHSKGGVHGAISPHSVVVARADGGVVPALTNLRVPANGAFCSPERVRGAGPTSEDDTWALFATLFAALTGVAPFAGKSRGELAARILGAGLPDPAAHGVGDAALQRLVQQGFHRSLRNRTASVGLLEQQLVDWLRSHPAQERDVPSVTPANPGSMSLLPPPIDDEDVAEAHRLAVQESPSDGDEDEDLETLTLAPVDHMRHAQALGTEHTRASAPHQQGLPVEISHQADEENYDDKTAVSSPPILGEMVAQLRSARGNAALPDLSLSGQHLSTPDRNPGSVPAHNDLDASGTARAVDRSSQDPIHAAPEVRHPSHPSAHDDATSGQPPRASASHEGRVSRSSQHEQSDEHANHRPLQHSIPLDKTQKRPPRGRSGAEHDIPLDKTLKLPPRGVSEAGHDIPLDKTQKRPPRGLSEAEHELEQAATTSIAAVQASREPSDPPVTQQETPSASAAREGRSEGETSFPSWPPPQWGGASSDPSARSAAPSGATNQHGPAIPDASEGADASDRDAHATPATEAEPAGKEPEPPAPLRLWTWIVGCLALLLGAVAAFFLAVRAVDDGLLAHYGLTPIASAEPAPLSSGAATDRGLPEAGAANGAVVDGGLSAAGDADAALAKDATSEGGGTDGAERTSSARGTGTTLSACVASYFPRGAFLPGLDFEPLCKSTNPRKSAVMLHRELVRGGAGGVSEGMRLWSPLSWYELAVVSIVRGGCCGQVAPLELPPTGRECVPLDEALRKVTQGGCGEQEAQRRTTEFGDAVRCLFEHKLPRPYRYHSVVGPLQDAAFVRFLRQLPPERCSK